MKASLCQKKNFVEKVQKFFRYSSISLFFFLYQCHPLILTPNLVNMDKLK